MNSLTNGNSETTAYAYLSNGWLASKTLDNGVVTTYTHDPQGRTTDLLNSQSGSTLSDYHTPSTGGYDGVGNRLSVTASMPGAPASYSGTTQYQYDYGQSANPALNRSQLTQETSTRASGTFSYGYDGGTSTGPGNPTSFKGDANTFNSDNQQAGSGYGYDGNGSPTTYKGSALTFDPEQRLTGYNGTTQTSGYDGDGLRTWKGSSNGSKTYFLYDGTQPVEETYGSNNFNRAYNTFGADGLVSRSLQTPPVEMANGSTSSSGSTTFYTFDERGCVSQRLTVSATQVGNPIGGGPGPQANSASPSGTSSTSTVSDVYDAYGSRTGTGGSDEWGYEGQAGYYTDTETGLILCTHRYYDPSNGRWLTRDPMGYGGGVNLYGYCQNDPGNRVDPRGLLDVWGDITAGAIGGAGVGLIVVIGVAAGAAAPVLLVVGTGIAVGAAAAEAYEYYNGSDATTIVEGGLIGGASGAVSSCIVKNFNPEEFNPERQQYGPGGINSEPPQPVTPQPVTPPEGFGGGTAGGSQGVGGPSPPGGWDGPTEDYPPLMPPPVSTPN